MDDSKKFCNQCGSPLGESVSAEDMPKPGKKKSKAPLLAILVLIAVLAAVAAMFFKKSGEDKGSLQQANGEAPVLEEKADGVLHEAEDEVPADGAYSSLEAMYGVWGIAKTVMDGEEDINSHAGNDLWIFYDGSAVFWGGLASYSSAEHQFAVKEDNVEVTLSDLEIYDITDSVCTRNQDGDSGQEFYEEYEHGYFRTFSDDGMKGWMKESQKLSPVDTKTYEAQVFFEKQYRCSEWISTAFLGDWSDNKGNTWHIAYDKEQGYVGSLKEENGAESILESIYIYEGKEESGYRNKISIYMEDAAGSSFYIEGYIEQLSKNEIVIDREEGSLTLTREGDVDGLYQDFIEDQLLLQFLY